MDTSGSNTMHPRRHGSGDVSFVVNVEQTNKARRSFRKSALFVRWLIAFAVVMFLTSGWILHMLEKEREQQKLRDKLSMGTEQTDAPHLHAHQVISNEKRLIVKRNETVAPVPPITLNLHKLHHRSNVSLMDDNIKGCERLADLMKRANSDVEEHKTFAIPTVGLPMASYSTAEATIDVLSSIEVPFKRLIVFDSASKYTDQWRLLREFREFIECIQEKVGSESVIVLEGFDDPLVAPPVAIESTDGSLKEVPITDELRQKYDIMRNARDIGQATALNRLIYEFNSLWRKKDDAERREDFLLLVVSPRSTFSKTFLESELPRIVRSQPSDFIVALKKRSRSDGYEDDTTDAELEVDDVYSPQTARDRILRQVPLADHSVQYEKGDNFNLDDAEAEYFAFVISPMATERSLVGGFDEVPFPLASFVEFSIRMQKMIPANGNLVAYRELYVDDGTAIPETHVPIVWRQRLKLFHLGEYLYRRWNLDTKDQLKNTIEDFLPYLYSSPYAGAMKHISKSNGGLVGTDVFTKLLDPLHRQCVQRRLEFRFATKRRRIDVTTGCEGPFYFDRLPVPGDVIVCANSLTTNANNPRLAFRETRPSYHEVQRCFFNFTRALVFYSISDEIGQQVVKSYFEDATLPHLLIDSVMLHPIAHATRSIVAAMSLEEREALLTIPTVGITLNKWTSYTMKYFFDQFFLQLTRNKVRVNEVIVTFQDVNSPEVDWSIELIAAEVNYLLQKHNPPRFLLLRTEEFGVSEARNEIIKQSQGQWILFHSTELLLRDDVIVTFLRKQEQSETAVIRKLHQYAVFVFNKERAFNEVGLFDEVLWPKCDEGTEMDLRMLSANATFEDWEADEILAKLKETDEMEEDENDPSTQKEQKSRFIFNNEHSRRKVAVVVDELKREVSVCGSREYLFRKWGVDIQQLKNSPLLPPAILKEAHFPIPFVLSSPFTLSGLAHNDSFLPVQSHRSCARGEIRTDSFYTCGQCYYPATDIIAKAAKNSAGQEVNAALLEWDKGGAARVALTSKSCFKDVQHTGLDFLAVSLERGEKFLRTSQPSSELFVPLYAILITPYRRNAIMGAFNIIPPSLGFLLIYVCDVQDPELEKKLEIAQSTKSFRVEIAKESDPSKCSTAASYNFILERAAELNVEWVWVMAADVDISPTDGINFANFTQKLLRSSKSVPTLHYATKWVMMAMSISFYKAVGSFDQTFFPHGGEDFEYVIRAKSIASSSGVNTNVVYTSVILSDLTSHHSPQVSERVSRGGSWPEYLFRKWGIDSYALLGKTGNSGVRKHFTQAISDVFSDTNIRPFAHPFANEKVVLFPTKNKDEIVLPRLLPIDGSFIRCVLNYNMERVHSCTSACAVDTTLFAPQLVPESWSNVSMFGIFHTLVSGVGCYELWWNQRHVRNSLALGKNEVVSDNNLLQQFSVLPRSHPDNTIPAIIVALLGPAALGRRKNPYAGLRVIVSEWLQGVGVKHIYFSSNGKMFESQKKLLTLALGGLEGQYSIFHKTKTESRASAINEGLKQAWIDGHSWAMTISSSILEYIDEDREGFAIELSKFAQRINKLVVRKEMVYLPLRGIEAFALSASTCKKVGGFDEQFELSFTGEDAEYGLKLASKGLFLSPMDASLFANSVSQSAKDLAETNAKKDKHFNVEEYLSLKWMNSTLPLTILTRDPNDEEELHWVLHRTVFTLFASSEGSKNRHVFVLPFGAEGAHFSPPSEFAECRAGHIRQYFSHTTYCSFSVLHKQQKHTETKAQESVPLTLLFQQGAAGLMKLERKKTESGSFVAAIPWFPWQSPELLAATIVQLSKLTVPVKKINIEICGPEYAFEGSPYVIDMIQLSRATVVELKRSELYLGRAGCLNLVTQKATSKNLIIVLDPSIDIEDDALNTFVVEMISGVMAVRERTTLTTSNLHLLKGLHIFAATAPLQLDENIWPAGGEEADFLLESQAAALRQKAQFLPFVYHGDPEAPTLVRVVPGEMKLSSVHWLELSFARWGVEEYFRRKWGVTMLGQDITGFLWGGKLRPELVVSWGHVQRMTTLVSQKGLNLWPFNIPEKKLQVDMGHRQCLRRERDESLRSCNTPSPFGGEQENSGELGSAYICFFDIHRAMTLSAAELENHRDAIAASSCPFCGETHRAIVNLAQLAQLPGKGHATPIPFLAITVDSTRKEIVDLLATLDVSFIRLRFIYREASAAVTSLLDFVVERVNKIIEEKKLATPFSVVKASNLGLAASWNDYFASIFGEESEAEEVSWAAVMSSNLHPNSRILQYFAERTGSLMKQRNIFIHKGKGWDLFALTKEGWFTLGRFDDAIVPSSFTGVEFEIRLAAFTQHQIVRNERGLRRLAVLDVPRDVFTESSPELSFEAVFEREKVKYREYLLYKWGIDVTDEVEGSIHFSAERRAQLYRIPFNGRQIDEHLIHKFVSCMAQPNPALQIRWSDGPSPEFKECRFLPSEPGEVGDEAQDTKNASRILRTALEACHSGNGKANEETIPVFIINIDKVFYHPIERLVATLRHAVICRVIFLQNFEQPVVTKFTRRIIKELGKMKKKVTLMLRPEQPLAKVWNEAITYAFRDPSVQWVLVQRPSSLLQNGWLQYVARMMNRGHKFIGTQLIERFHIFAISRVGVEKVGLFDQAMNPSGHEDEYLLRLRASAKDEDGPIFVLTAPKPGGYQRLPFHPKKVEYDYVKFHRNGVAEYLMRKWGFDGQRHINPLDPVPLFRYPFGITGLALPKSIVTDPDVEHCVNTGEGKTYFGTKECLVDPSHVIGSAKRPAWPQFSSPLTVYRSYLVLALQFAVAETSSISLGICVMPRTPIDDVYEFAAIVASSGAHFDEVVVAHFVGHAMQKESIPLDGHPIIRVVAGVEESASQLACVKAIVSRTKGKVLVIAHPEQLVAPSSLRHFVRSVEKVKIDSSSLVLYNDRMALFAASKEALLSDWINSLLLIKCRSGPSIMKNDLVADPIRFLDQTVQLIRYAGDVNQENCDNIEMTRGGWPNVTHLLLLSGHTENTKQKKRIAQTIPYLGIVVAEHDAGKVDQISSALQLAATKISVVVVGVKHASTAIEKKCIESNIQLGKAESVAEGWNMLLYEALIVGNASWVLLCSPESSLELSHLAELVDRQKKEPSLQVSDDGRSIVFTRKALDKLDYFDEALWPAGGEILEMIIRATSKSRDADRLSIASPHFLDLPRDNLPGEAVAYLLRKWGINFGLSHDLLKSGVVSIEPFITPFDNPNYDQRKRFAASTAFKVCMLSRHGPKYAENGGLTAISICVDEELLSSVSESFDNIHPSDWEVVRNLRRRLGEGKAAAFDKNTHYIPVFGTLVVRADFNHFKAMLGNIGTPILRLVIVVNTMSAEMDAFFDWLQSKLDTSSVKVIEPNVNVGVAGGWNLVAEHAFAGDSPAPFVVIANADFLIHRRLLPQFVEEAWKVSKDQNVAVYHFNERYAFFALMQAGYKKIGLFDSVIWPAYSEDVEYSLRVRMKGMMRLSFNISGIPYAAFHYTSSSVKEGGEFKHLLDRWGREEYILRKWGYNMMIDWNSMGWADLARSPLQLVDNPKEVSSEASERHKECVTAGEGPKYWEEPYYCAVTSEQIISTQNRRLRSQTLPDPPAGVVYSLNSITKPLIPFFGVVAGPNGNEGLQTLHALDVAVGQVLVVQYGGVDARHSAIIAGVAYDVPDRSFHYLRSSSTAAAWNRILQRAFEQEVNNTWVMMTAPGAVISAGVLERFAQRTNEIVEEVDLHLLFGFAAFAVTRRGFKKLGLFDSAELPNDISRHGLDYITRAVVSGAHYRTFFSGRKPVTWVRLPVAADVCTRFSLARKWGIHFPLPFLESLNCWGSLDCDAAAAWSVESIHSAMTQHSGLAAEDGECYIHPFNNSNLKTSHHFEDDRIVLSTHNLDFAYLLAPYAPLLISSPFTHGGSERNGYHSLEDWRDSNCGLPAMRYLIKKVKH